MRSRGELSSLVFLNAGQVTATPRPLLSVGSALASPGNENPALRPAVAPQPGKVWPLGEAGTVLSIAVVLLETWRVSTDSHRLPNLLSGGFLATEQCYRSSCERRVVSVVPPLTPTSTNRPMFAERLKEWLAKLG